MSCTGSGIGCLRREDQPGATGGSKDVCTGMVVRNAQSMTSEDRQWRYNRIDLSIQPKSATSSPSPLALAGLVRRHLGETESCVLELWAIDSHSDEPELVPGPDVPVGQVSSIPAPSIPSTPSRPSWNPATRLSRRRHRHRRYPALVHNSARASAKSRRRGLAGRRWACARRSVVALFLL